MSRPPSTTLAAACVATVKPPVPPPRPPRRTARSLSFADWPTRIAATSTSAIHKRPLRPGCLAMYPTSRSSNGAMARSTHVPAERDGQGARIVPAYQLRPRADGCSSTRRSLKFRRTRESPARLLPALRTRRHGRLPGCWCAPVEADREPRSPFAGFDAMRAQWGKPGCPRIPSTRLDYHASHSRPSGTRRHEAHPHLA